VSGLVRSPISPMEPQDSANPAQPNARLALTEPPAPNVRLGVYLEVNAQMYAPHSCITLQTPLMDAAAPNVPTLARSVQDLTNAYPVLKATSWAVIA
jgi:hypothetical protein